MRVAFISFYQNLVNRGVERWLKDLVPHLDPKIETKIFSPSKNQIKLSPPYYSSSPLRKIFLDSHSLAILQHTRKIFSQLKDFDLIIPLNGGWQTLLVKLATLKFKNKMIIIGHSGLGRDDRFNLALNPQAFIALSDHQANWANKYYSHPIHTIPNGVDLKRFTPQGKKLSLKLQVPIILSATSLQKQAFLKNLILATSSTPASLIVAGSGTPRQQQLLDSLAQKHLPHRYLRKQFTPTQMPVLYRSVDLFVYPNPSYESFGLVFLEALASNLPVIATDDPIRRQIIGQAGLFINPHDLNSITHAINQALETNWDSKPRQQAQNFSLAKMGKKYSQVILSL